jgi:hypothetical protein
MRRDAHTSLKSRSYFWKAIHVERMIVSREIKRERQKQAMMDRRHRDERSYESRHQEGRWQHWEGRLQLYTAMRGEGSGSVAAVGDGNWSDGSLPRPGES